MPESISIAWAYMNSLAVANGLTEGHGLIRKNMIVKLVKRMSRGNGCKDRPLWAKQNKKQNPNMNICECLPKGDLSKERF